MNIAHSADRPPHEYQPTIIESRPLISRLAILIAYFRVELKRSWPEFKKDPVGFASARSDELLQGIRRSPNAIPAIFAAVVAIAFVIVMALVVDRTTRITDPALVDVKPEVVLLAKPRGPANDSIGLDRRGRVGFRKGTGEGSGPSQKFAGGGGSGGDHSLMPIQSGKLAPPSEIQAAIPTAPLVHVQSLPVAGMDIDPALWTDLKAPVFGDPRATTIAESKGPGEGGGMGTKNGLGIGDGSGPGYGRGKNGNMCGGSRELGCGRDGGGGGDGGGNPAGLLGFYRATEVEQRARLLSKPEPQYTEEARRNQVSGTVVLRVIFSSNGEVVQIRAVHTLPFGLTERAIAAARQIQFVPAVKGGQPVSVAMQLEYNFNLY